ncbi:MAG TPA: hypothetical protein VFE02_05620 [Candidatus Acidoferrales bacterium]|jgi:hypothetical protein|nr:hypothetical protein [Candidatus Acidoferrales bacterium]
METGNLRMDFVENGLRNRGEDLIALGKIPASKSISRIGVSGVIPAEQMAGEDEEDLALLREMKDNAETFLKSCSWCLNIQESLFGAGIGTPSEAIEAYLEECPSGSNWLGMDRSLTTSFR